MATRQILTFFIWKQPLSLLPTQQSKVWQRKMQCSTAETRIFQRPTQPSKVWLTEKIEFFNGDPANFDSFYF